MTEVLRYAAFTVAGAGGNPAGVVLDATSLDDAAMLAIAADLGYSEMAFLDPTPDPSGRRRVRYFSPRAEVAFCGHATIATAVAYAERHGPGSLPLHTLAGEVDVTSRRGADSVLRATLTSVPATSRPLTGDDRTALLDALRLAPTDLAADWPVHVANAGNDHPVVVLASRALLAGLDYDYPALDALMADRGWTTVQVVWPEDAATWHSRNPFPPGGIREDPATGAAAAAFGRYLDGLGRWPQVEQVAIRQGEDNGTPSELVVERAGADRFSVTGAAARISA